MDLHIIPITNEVNQDAFIIYRPLRQLAFVGNRAMVDLAQAILQDGEQTFLGTAGKAETFLNEIGFLRPALPIQSTLPTEFKPTTAVLLMTNQCQLRCTYCYAAAGTMPREQLTIKQGCAAIDYVYQSAQEQGHPYFELSLHGGGEPTYAWHVLKECVAYARQKPLPAQIGLTSNGIWSPTQREWILSHLDNVSISLDGSPQTQDEHRPFISGAGSAEIVMQTIAALDQHNFQYGIRMTVTAPWEHLPDDVAYICNQTNCPVIQAEPAFKTTPGGHVHGSADDYAAFAMAFAMAYEIASQAGRHMFYSGARLGLVTDSFCLAPYNALIITPRGQLVTCYEITDDNHPLASISTFGTYADNEFSIHENVRMHLHHLMDERHESCKDCFCYHSCAGDCYTRAWGHQENGHLQHSLRCQLNRTLTQNLLLSAISSGGGVWDGQQQAHHVTA
ncbi:MAG: SPASM domain-containing protein [Ardenticatenaceae bacterium]|nr:SPASM domain-containing protein [Ardenticatenaceae bacterium]